MRALRNVAALLLGAALMLAVIRPRPRRAVVSAVTSVDRAPGVAVVMHAGERCDKRACGAQARVRLYIRDASFIQFCKHHADELPDDVYGAAEYVLNESQYI